MRPLSRVVCVAVLEWHDRAIFKHGRASPAGAGNLNFCVCLAFFYPFLFLIGFWCEHESFR